MKTTGKEHPIMKKCLLIILALLMFISIASAAETEPAVFGSVSFPKDVEYIDMGAQTVEDWDAFISFLSEFPNLKKVDMFSTTVERAHIQKLEQHFPDMKFGWTIHIIREHYVRTDQTAFSTLHGSCSMHSSHDLELLKYCTEMLALDIGHNDLTDITFLQNMPKLRVLILACNENLRNIQVLSQLKDLEYLELFSCAVRDITPLKDLPHLMDLNISYNQLTKYSVLNEMPQLKRLWLPQSGVPVYGESFMQLQKDLPNTLIMNKGHPTNYGWREGNHYETIYTMFRANEYIPFEDSYPLETKTTP